MMVYLKMLKVSSKIMICCAICYTCYFLNSGKVVGYVHELNGGIHHTDCMKYVPLDLQSLICSKCSKFRENVLRGRLAQHLQEKKWYPICGGKQPHKFSVSYSDKEV